MFAWRGRIGLVKPTHRGKAFAFWYKYAPEGVEIVPTFIGFKSGERDDFERGFARAEELAVQLREADCDVVAVSGSPPFLLRGLDFEREWASRLARRIGVPLITPMEPHAIALASLGARRVAVATYYGSELNDAIVAYFARFGIEALALPGFSLTGRTEGLYTTPLRALDAASAADVYRHCRDGVRRLGSRVDAVYINGGGWDAAPAIDYLERDLCTKVVWALAAEMWLAYARLGVALRVEGCGSLLRDGYEPQPARDA